MALDAKNPASTMWFAASTAALLLTALYGLMLYPSMPDPVPVHWDGGGFPDRYAAKSGLAVFMPLIVGLAGMALLWLLHHFLPALAAGTGGDNARQQAGAGRLVLVRLCPALSAFISWLAIRGWLGLVGPAMIWVPTVLLVFVSILLVFRAVSTATAFPTDQAPSAK